MSQTKKPLPKSQLQISQDTIEPYLNQGKSPLPSNKRRENQRSVKDDEVKQFSVGLKDFDQAIIYYFNNVIRPSVIQNGTQINVPFIYGSPEKWAAVQKDGYYRDNNGKIQTPLIMFKRDSVEKNRSLGNKMDANLPSNFGIFEKKYSKKNVYDRFSLLTNRIPVKEYYAITIPDYVNITYSCTIFTEYVEQMNKIVESVNFASDSYWGDPEKFKFRADIDSYQTVTEQVQGEDRVVKTTFQIKLAGYIVSNAINTPTIGQTKFFSKAAVKFGMETAGTTEILNAKAGTPAKQAPSRFFDGAGAGGGTSTSGMTLEQITYVGISNTALADSISGTVASFSNHIIPATPTYFPELTEGDFQVYINGIMIPVQNRVTTLPQVGSDITVTFNDLGFTLDSTDQIVIVGKFS